MQSSFEGVNLKLERAKSHINDLNRQLGAFTDLKPWSARLQVEAQDGKDVARLIAVKNRSVADPDTVPLVLLAGEALYQLRSALDHLIHQLVIANGNAAILEGSTSHQFPIFDTPEGYRSRAGRKIDGVSDRVRFVLEDEQPYKRIPEAPHEDLLWILQDLNNTDKHRLIPATVVGIKVVDLYDSKGKLGIVNSHDVVLEDGKVFMTLVNDQQRYNDIRPDLTCAIAFEQAMRAHDITVGMDTMLWRIASRISDIMHRLP